MPTSLRFLCPVCSLKPDYADAHCDLGCTYCAQVCIGSSGCGCMAVVGPGWAWQLLVALLRCFAAPFNCCLQIIPTHSTQQGDVENAKKCFKNAIKCAPQHLEVSGHPCRGSCIGGDGRPGKCSTSSRWRVRLHVHHVSLVPRPAVLPPPLQPACVLPFPPPPPGALQHGQPVPPVRRVWARRPEVRPPRRGAGRGRAACAAAACGQAGPAAAPANKRVESIDSRLTDSIQLNSSIPG